MRLRILLPLRARQLRHPPGWDESRRGFDVRLAIVEIDMRAAGGEERRFGAAANKMDLVEKHVPAAQGADDALVGGIVSLGVV